MTDQEARALLSRATAGDEAAFGTLYRSLQAAIHGFAWSKTRDDADADEVVVETMHAVWCQAARFEGRSSVKTWVLGIAHNKALMKRRSQRIHEDVDDYTDSLPDTAGDIIDIIEKTEAALQVKRCLERLPAKHRDCLHLFSEDCSIAVIADITQVPEGTVKSRLHHAKAALKRCLGLAIHGDRL